MTSSDGKVWWPDDMTRREAEILNMTKYVPTLCEKAMADTLAILFLVAFFGAPLILIGIWIAEVMGL